MRAGHLPRTPPFTYCILHILRGTRTEPRAWRKGRGSACCAGEMPCVERQAVCSNRGLGVTCVAVCVLESSSRGSRVCCLLSRLEALFGLRESECCFHSQSGPHRDRECVSQSLVADCEDDLAFGSLLVLDHLDMAGLGRARTIMSEPCQHRVCSSSEQWLVWDRVRPAHIIMSEPHQLMKSSSHHSLLLGIRVQSIEVRAQGFGLRKSRPAVPVMGCESACICFRSAGREGRALYRGVSERERRAGKRLDGAWEYHTHRH